MSGGQWQIVNFPSTGTAATASITSGTTGSAVIRLRALQVTATGSATLGTIVTFVVRDGATGAGTIIWETGVAVGTSQMTGFAVADLDLRATGGTLTIESTGAGAAGTQLAVNAQGDFTATGRQYGGE